VEKEDDPDARSRFTENMKRLPLTSTALIAMAQTRILFEKVSR
jgi:hypothetical protein